MAPNVAIGAATEGRPYNHHPGIFVGSALRGRPNRIVLKSQNESSSDQTIHSYRSARED